MYPQQDSSPLGDLGVTLVILRRATDHREGGVLCSLWLRESALGGLGI